jgi:hypothetical protein
VARLAFSGTKRFEVLSCLGSGGMGSVYAARDRERNVAVALKTLAADEPELLLRLKNEFRSLQDLDHPNLVSLGELCCEGGQWFFTMELVEGRDLRSHVRNDPPPGGAEAGGDDDAPPSEPEPSAAFDEDRLRSSLAQLAEGLLALHAAEKVHRDIKPSNVLVTAAGRVVLLDFGLVADQAAPPDDSAVVGTSAYMAPEQGASQYVGAPADWYSVGVILYELLTGVLPFRGPQLRVLMDKQVRDPVPPSELVAGVPAELSRLAMALLDREPGRRAGGAEVLLVARGNAARSPALALATRPSGAALFVGRDTELGVLEAAFADAAASKACAVLLSGESGVGKSALARRFLARVEASASALALRGRCYERESLPFKALDRVVDELSVHLAKLPTAESAGLVPRHAALLARLFPVLRRVEAIASAPRSRRSEPSPLEQRNRAFGALRELVLRLSAQQPLIVFIDDLQWADTDSLALLTELLRAPSPRLLLIGTLRGADDARRAVLAEALPIAVRELALDSLSAEHARALVERLSEAAAIPASGIAAIAAESAGHPMFIHELVRHVETTGVATAAAVRLDDALWARIELLEPPARRVLATVAVAGAPLAQSVVARACELSFADYQRWASSLRAARLLRGSGARATDWIDTYHARVRDAVLQRVDVAARRGVHLRVALALAAVGAGDVDAQALVYHLESAGEHERAAEHAAQAAARAAAAFAFDRAAELYRAALRLGDYERSVARELELALAGALANGARCREAADAFLAAADDADPATRLECQRNAAIQLLMSGHLERGVRTLQDVLVAAGLRYPATPRRALASVIAGRARLALRGTGWVERHEREIADAELSRIDVCAAVATALGTVDTIRGHDFQTQLMLRALRAGEPTRIAMAFAAEAVYRATHGARGIAAGRRLALEARAIAERHADPVLSAWTTGAAGIVDYFDCQLVDARGLLERAERMLLEATAASAWVLNTVRLFRLWTLRYTGESRAMRELTTHYLRDAARCGDRYFETTIAWGCAVGWLELDDVLEARRRLDVSTWSAPEEGYHLQHWYQLKGRCELALYERRRGADALAQLEHGFRAVASSLLFRIDIVRAEAAWLHGRLALMVAEETGARPELMARVKQMIRRVGRSPRGYTAMFAAALRAGLAVQQGNAEAAIASLDEAERGCGARSMASHAAALRRQRGVLLGGAEGERLIASADAVLAGEGIVRPERYTAMLVPGMTRARL